MLTAWLPHPLTPSTQTGECRPVACRDRQDAARAAPDKWQTVPAPCPFGRYARTPGLGGNAHREGWDCCLTPSHIRERLPHNETDPNKDFPGENELRRA